jgi:hypothetical protein
MLNVHGVSDVRQAEIHAAEPLVPEPSVLEVELALENLKSKKSPGIDQIPSELINAGGMTIRCAIHKEQIEVRECLLLFDAESFVLQVAIQKLKYQDI